MAGLLYRTEYPINDYIKIKIPTVGEVIDDEDNYNAIVSIICATPYDMMVQLDDNGIDFTTIDDWELFCLLFRGLQDRDTSLVFGDLNLKDFEMLKNTENGEVVLANLQTGAIIDRSIHYMIAKFLREVMGIERTNKKPGNEEARLYMIERARKKQQRARRNKKPHSQLESFIISLVNTSEFSYDYRSVRDLTIYQFFSSLRQISNKTRYDKLMIGVYAGTVNVKEINQSELSWFAD